MKKRYTSKKKELEDITKSKKALESKAFRIRESLEFSSFMCRGKKFSALKKVYEKIEILNRKIIKLNSEIF